MSVLNYKTDNNIAVIEINSPPVNALGINVRRGLIEGAQKAWDDASIDAIVVICAGRTFFAGADIKEFGKPPVAPDLSTVCETLENGPKPIIAAMHGTALGGGLEIALHCHFRIAVPSGKMGLPEVKLGILPGAGGTQRLPRLVGVPAALDLITKGDPFKAEQALEYGVIDRLAAEGSLEADAIAFAKHIITSGVEVVRVRDRDEKLTPHRGETKIYDDFRAKNARKFRGFPAPENIIKAIQACLLYTSPSPRDKRQSRMPSSA